MMADADGFEPALGHRFADPALLRQALTHSSGSTDRMRSNERLEFLGDRVLGLVVADMLYERFPDEEEGALARRHAALVQRESLARVSRGIGLPDHLILSMGEAETGGRENDSLLADACEAVIAALYLDGGLDAARDFVHAHWSALMEENPTPPKDAKTALQEWAQGRGKPLPSYREVSREGPDHAPTFTIEVSVEGLDPAIGTGSSKRLAAQAAAEAMLARATGDAK